MGFAFICKRNQLLLNAAIVEKGKFVFPGARFLIDPGLFVKAVIVAKALLIQ